MYLILIRYQEKDQRRKARKQEEEEEEVFKKQERLQQGAPQSPEQCGSLK